MKQKPCGILLLYAVWWIRRQTSKLYNNGLLEIYNFVVICAIKFFEQLRVSILAGIAGDIVHRSPVPHDRFCVSASLADTTFRHGWKGPPACRWSFWEGVAHALHPWIRDSWRIWQKKSAQRSWAAQIPLHFGWRWFGQRPDSGFIGDENLLSFIWSPWMWFGSLGSNHYSCWILVFVLWCGGIIKKFPSIAWARFKNYAGKKQGKCMIHFGIWAGFHGIVKGLSGDGAVIKGLVRMNSCNNTLFGCIL